MGQGGQILGREAGLIRQPDIIKWPLREFGEANVA
jgi:hypothetical protein